LTFFARNFGAKARIAVRFDREDWYFFHPGDLYTTDAGSYRVKKETALADGTDFPEFVGETEKVTLDQVGADGGGVDPEAEERREVLEAVRDGHMPVEDALDVL